MTTNKITDTSNDKKYFVQVPHIVMAKCRTPQDLSLWMAIKTVSGDLGECFLSTEDLATLAMMSAGKASDSREYLINAGLIAGEIRRDPGYPQPVWHLSVPDLWKENIKWREENAELKARIQQRREFTDKLRTGGTLRTVKPQTKKEPSQYEGCQEPSQYEEGIPQNEEGIPQNETKKNQPEPNVKPNNNNGNSKNLLYADADEYASLPDAVKQSLRSNDADWQYLVKRFKAVRMDLSINAAKEDDMWRLYKSLTPPPGETVKQWVDYVAGRAADKPTAPGWKFVETIFTAIQASGSLAKNIAEFEARYKSNGNGKQPETYVTDGRGGIYL